MELEWVAAGLAADHAAALAEAEARAVGVLEVREDPVLGQ